MQPTAFGHQIQTLHEGLTAFQGGAGRFIPMQATDIDIQITAGVAIIRTQRVFRNDEDVAIEAVLTMPVGFDAVVTGLSATVDDRKLVAVAKPQSAARDDYEVAIDKGKMAILHEEVLKGVHTLSVAQLAPGKEVVIELETVTAIALLTTFAFSCALGCCIFACTFRALGQRRSLSLVLGLALALVFSAAIS